VPITQFSPRVSEALGYYVYLYLDPRDGSIFYVGKGKGNRAFSHMNDLSETRKVQTIHAIRAAGLEPTIEILVHRLPNEETALRIEAAIIDLLTLDRLTNQVRGWESSIVGRMPVAALASLYDARPIKIGEAALLIRINQLYRYGMSERELFEVTRGVWKLGARRTQAKYAFAVYKGVVREVYEIGGWHPAGTLDYLTRNAADLRLEGRWEFEGHVADAMLREKYIDGSVSHYFAGNSQNPVTYVNC